MLYVAPRPNFDILDRDIFNRTKNQGFCAKCGEKIKWFNTAPFSMEAGHGFFWEVHSSCGLCESCFNALKKSKECYVSSYDTELVREDFRYETTGVDGKKHMASVISRDGFRN